MAASLSAAATTFTPSSGPGETSRPISSATMQVSTRPSPEMLSPPASGATVIEFQPSSLPRRRVSGISFSRNSLVVERNSLWSAVSSKSIR